MIIPVYKYLILGLNEQLDAFFEKAQEKGFIEFVSAKGKKSIPFPEELQVIRSAIKIMRKQPIKKEVEEPFESQQLFSVAQRICGLQSEIDKLLEEERATEAEISRVAPLGEFSLEDIAFIHNHAGRTCQFFCMSASKELPPASKEHLWYINTEYDLNYFLSIELMPTSYPDMIEMKIDRSLSQLKNYQQFIHESIRLLEAELKGYAGHLESLQSALLDYIDEFSLDSAKEKVFYPLTDAFFAVEAWIPENKLHALHGMVHGLDICIERVATNKNEKVPTYIENKGFSKVGEDLVNIYDVPSTADKDPSGWVLWTFALFFAMIVSDAGYGLIYLAIAFLAERRMKDALSPLAKRLIKLGKVLGTSCILWGCLTASCFGLNFDLQNPVVKVSLLNYLVEKKAEYHVQVKDSSFREVQAEYPKATIEHKNHLLSLGAEKLGEKTATYEEFSKNILLELSLLIGVVHICASLCRYMFRNYANIGWVLFAVGGYLYFPSMLDAASLIQVMGLTDAPTAHALGAQLLIVGISCAVLLSIIQNGWRGIKEVLTMIQITADILSYLRLYALALASSIMAATFNDICVSMLGLVMGSIALLAGHCMNFILGTMGGVIHGLRLNFIEWYHYSFEGGGKLLNPLRRLKIFSST